MSLGLDEMNEFGELYNSISAYVKENISLFVSGDKNLDGDWTEFQQSLENLNVARYLELAQQGYEAFLTQDQ